MLGSHRCLAELQDGLNQAGFMVISLDLLGFGRSPWHADSFDVDAHLDAIRARVVEFGRYLVVGHSLGSLLGRELLARDPNCIGCVSVSTPAFNSCSAFHEHTWRANLIAWILVRSPRWATWLMCTALCQQRWFWRPVACALYDAFHCYVDSHGTLTRAIIEDFFDH